MQDPGQGRYIPEAKPQLTNSRSSAESDGATAAPAPVLAPLTEPGPQQVYPAVSSARAQGPARSTRGAEQRARLSPRSPSPGQDVPARPRGQTCRGVRGARGGPRAGLRRGEGCPPSRVRPSPLRPPPRAAPGASRGRSAQRCRDRERAGGSGSRLAASAPHPRVPAAAGRARRSCPAAGTRGLPACAGWAETAAPQSFPGHSPAELMVLPRRGAALLLVPYATAPLRDEEKEPIVPPRRHPAGGEAGAGAAPPARHRRIPPRGTTGAPSDAARRRPLLAPPAGPSSRPAPAASPPRPRPVSTAHNVPESGRSLCFMGTVVLPGAGRRPEGRGGARRSAARRTRFPSVPAGRGWHGGQG